MALISTTVLRTTITRCLRNSSTHAHSPTRSVLVLGSSGCLGSVTATHLSREHNMVVIGADVVESRNKNAQPDHFVQLPKDGSLGDLTGALVTGLDDILRDEYDIDAIICANGGWEGDPTSNKDDDNFVSPEEDAHRYSATIERMMRINLYPVAAAGYAAQHFMANQGLFVVVGATAALSPTPGMLGYGMSKTAAHHFVQTVGAMTGNALSTKSQRKVARRLRQGSEYLDEMSVVGVLPSTIDTPSNRAAMPTVDKSQWTDPKDIGQEIGKWIDQPHLRPHSGSLIKVLPNTSGGKEPTVFQIAR